MLILNLGCGQNPLKSTEGIHYCNMDMLNLKERDGIDYIKHNITKLPYPIISNYVDKVYLFHTIEHIPETAHCALLREIHRVLKPGGELAISYPEFIKVAQNYIDNKGDRRDFWKATIYGRGLTIWDRHCSLMNTEEFVPKLRTLGLIPVRVSAEPKQTFNTVIIAKKGEPIVSYETLMGKEFNERTST